MFFCDAPWLNNLTEELESYFGGGVVSKRGFRDVPLDLSDLTAFQRKIYLETMKVKPGSVVSYGELAKRCGKPGAARAVGYAMAKNLIPLIIPCHRVVAANGSLGGFSAADGVSAKARLLQLEGVRLL